MSGNVSAARAVGVTKWFSDKKGFGFITPEGGGPDVFVHSSEVEKSGLVDGLSEGERISFETVPGKSGKGPKAINLALA